MGGGKSRLIEGQMTGRIGRRGTGSLQRGPFGKENKITGHPVKITRPSWDTVKRSSLKANSLNKTLTSINGCTLRFKVSGPINKTLTEDPTTPKAKIEAKISLQKAGVKIQSKKYVFPVAAPWKFRDSWGDRRAYRDRRDKDGKLIKAYHGGVDIYSSVGQEVYAITDGKIISIHDNPKSRTGKKVFLLGNDGIQYGYVHVDKIKVKKRQQVKKGELIAYSGRTGIKKSPAHTHFQMKKGKNSIDPFELLVKIAGFNLIVRSKNKLRTYYYHQGDFGLLLIRRREELKRRGLIVQE